MSGEPPPEGSSPHEREHLATSAPDRGSAGVAPPRTPRSTWARGPAPALGALLLVLLALPLVFAGLGSYSLVNGDEAIYRLISLRMLETGDWWTLHDGVEARVYDTFMNAPLHYWARAGLHAVFGEGLAVSRLLSALFGLATVLVTARLAWRLSGGDRWAAFLAGFVQLTTYQALWLHGARTGELETLVSFLVTAALLLFLRAVRTGGGFWWHHACLAALLMTKLPLPLLPVAAELVWFALTPSARPHARRWLLQGLALLPLALGWHALQALRMGDAFGQVLATMAHEARSGSLGHEAGRVSNWSYYARRLPFGTYPWGLLAPVALLFGLVGGVRASTARGPAASDAARTRAEDLRLPALLALVVVVFFLVVEKHAPWYPTPAYPSLAVCLALLVVAVARRSRVSAGVLVVAALVLGLLVWLDVDLLSHQPLDRTAQQMGMRARWQRGLGLSPLLGVLLAAGVALGLLGLAARRAGGRGVALVLVLPFAALALARCLAPLQHLGHQSELAQIRARLDGRLAAGEAVAYPVAVTEGQVWIVRATFSRDHRVIERRPGGRGNRPGADSGPAFLVLPLTDEPER